MEKRRFKVMCAIPKRDGAGSWWMRVGDAFTNKDDSINVYLHVIPKELTLTLRDLDERDLERLSRGKSRAITASGGLAAGPTETPF
ncbi:MAG: hypothetical protein AB7P03_15675 [Kofleriaceae bacterium]